MGNHLRDEYVKNVLIDEDTIKKINDEFKKFESNSASTSTKRPVLFYIIRFDNKGYRVFSIDELLQYFRQAKTVERIIFKLETQENISTNGAAGTTAELALDQKDTNLCMLKITSDDNDLVNSSFLKIQEILDGAKNKNGWVRTAWTQLAIQILGIIFAFILSLWGASKISSKLIIENSFAICFLFIFLVFSNMWSYLNNRIFALLNSIFPNIKFHRSHKDTTHWFTQAIAGGIALALTLWVLNLVFLHLGEILIGFLNKKVT